MSDVIIVNTLKRGKLLTRKTGHSTVYHRRETGLVKIVIRLNIEIGFVTPWQLLKPYNFLKVTKIRKQRLGDKVYRLLIISILTVKESKRFWRALFRLEEVNLINISFDDKNRIVRGMRRWRQIVTSAK